MPPSVPDHLLDQAAELWGIELRYRDIWGREHVASADTKRSLLCALDVPAADPDALQAAVADRQAQDWLRLAPPTLVLSVGQKPREFPVSARAEEAHSMVSVKIYHEDGFGERYDVSLGLFPVSETEDIGGLRYVRKAIPLPPDLDIGYYDVEVSTGERSARMRLILAPDQAYLPENLRAAGIAVSLYGVRSAHNWGCGDFRDLKDLINWASDELGVASIGLNPLHAIHNRRPYNTSPYLPNSTYFRNPIYLDIESIDDFRSSPRACNLWQQARTQAALAELRASEFVEYESIQDWKLRFLKLAFLEFLGEWRSDGPRARQFRLFLVREGDLLDRFAIHSALDEFLHRRDPAVWSWPDWPEPYRDPQSAETSAFAKKHWRSVLFYKYVQWQIDCQLADVQEHARRRGLSIGLYHDLALATDSRGSDLWAHQPFFVSGCRVGSPPDDFAPKGQDWAFPPPHTDHHYETGYHLFVRSIRNNARHGGALRIDHVMRLFRLYWIPDGSDAASGTYVRDRAEDLIRILALESVRQKVILVGEDLGTVEPAIRESLERFGILSYRLFYFERDSGGDFLPYQSYPVQALVSSTTHDLPTFAGFWVNEDIEARRRVGLLDERGYLEQLHARARDRQRMLDLLFRLNLLPEHFPRAAVDVPELTGELHNAVIGFLALAPSRLLLINQEDLTKEIAQQNLPGTTWQYPNWGRKMKFSIEDLRTEKLAIDFAAMLRNWLLKSGRR